MKLLSEVLVRLFCYICLIRVLLHMLPENSMKKYVRFILMMLLLLIVFEPLAEVLGKSRGLQYLKWLEREAETVEGDASALCQEKDWDEEQFEKSLLKNLQELQEKQTEQKNP